MQAAGATGSTTSPGDVVSGGAGTDTFNLSVAGDAGGAYTLQAVQLKDVENVLATNFDLNAAATTVDTSLMTGVEKVGLGASSATGDTIFSGMTSIVDAQMSNGSADLTMTYAAGTSGTADVQNLALSAVTAGTFDAAGIETIAVTGSLTANKLTNITGSTLKTISVAGDQNFTMTGSTTVKTIDAAANTGKTSLVLGAANQKVTLGAGDDTVDIGANLTAADAIQGGEGTDTLKLSAAGTINGMASAADVTAEFAQSGGFEVIDIASTADAATLNLKNIAGVETVKAAANVLTVVLDANDTDTTKATDSVVIGFTLNGTAYTTAAQDADATSGEAATLLAAKINTITGFSATATGANIAITNTSASSERVDFALTAGHAAEDSQAYNDLTISGVTDQAIDIFTADKVSARLVDPSGTEDQINVNLKSVTADAAAAQTITEIDIADTIETLNLNATGMKTGLSAVQKTVSTLTADNSLTTLNLSGSDKLTISTLTAGKLATINAADATGDVSLPGTSSLAQTITMGSGNDTLVMGANLTAADVIDMGGNSAITAAGKLGNDTVTTSGNQGTAVLAAALQISNAEVVTIEAGGAASNYIDGSKLDNVGALAFSNTSGASTLTNMPAGTAIGLGVAAAESASTYTVSLADATGTEDALTLAYGSGIDASTSNTIVVAGVETLNVVASAEAANDETSTLVLTNAAVSTINVTGGHSGDTTALGTLNKATTAVTAGANKGIVSFDAATGVGMTVSAAAAVANVINLSTKADTVTLTGLLGTTIQDIDGGATASAATSDTISATITSAASDFTSVSGFEVVNLTVPAATAVGFDNATKNDGVENASVVNILGGNANSTFTIDATAKLDRDKTSAAAAQTIDASTFAGKTVLNFGSDDLDIFTTVKGGASALDSVTTTISAAASSTAGNNPTMSGIEYLTVASTNSDTDAVINLANVTDLARVTASFVTAGAADQIEIDGLAAGVPVYVSATNATDNLDVGLASASGSSDAVTIVSAANNAGLNLDAAGIESLSIVSSVASSYDLAGVAPSTGGATTVTLTGAGNVAITALNTSTTEINGAGMGGALTVGAAARDADAITITGGVNNDSIAMENAADVLTGGSQAVGGADTLVVNYSAVLGGATVDLSADDQVVSMDGGPNAAVQSGFENVDLRAFSGFGSVVTGSDGANVITGTAGVDRITAGKGNDTIQVALTNDANTDQVNGGAGTADTLTMLAGDYVPAGDDNLVGVEVITSAATSTLDLSSQTEGFTITGGANVQTITGGEGVDEINGGAGNDVFVVKTGTGSFSSTTAIDTTAAGGVTTLTGIDVYKGLNAGDKIDLSAVDGGTAISDATVADGTTELTAATAGGVAFILGTYDETAKTFTEGTTFGAGTVDDYLVQWADGTNYEAVVFVGLSAEMDSLVFSSAVGTLTT